MVKMKNSVSSVCGAVRSVGLAADKAGAGRAKMRVGCPVCPGTTSVSLPGFGKGGKVTICDSHGLSGYPNMVLSGRY